MNKNINIPFALDYEEATLGALPLETKAMPIACQRLRPKVFYDDKHQIITAIESMFNEGHSINIITAAKHRNGETGNVYFSHNKSMTKIADYTPPMEWLMKQAK